MTALPEQFDVRGRSRGARLPGPYGFAAHVADLVAYLGAGAAGHAIGAAGTSG